MTRFLGLCAGLLLAGCEILSPLTSSDRRPAGGPAPDSLRPVVLFETLDAVDLKTDPASVPAARVDGGMLVLEVVYGGGCRTHAFALFAATYLAESYPPQAALYLSHDADGDRCRALLRDTLYFDLSPARTVWNHDGPVYLNLHPPGGPARRLLMQ